MNELVALGGRALFDPEAVAFDVEAGRENDGPFYAWMLFTWIVNSMVPEVFATKESNIEIEDDTPAIGWTTERYKQARIMHPPVGSGNKILVQADDHRLYPVWDQAMKQLVSGNLHTH